MRELYGCVCLLALFISGYRTDDPTVTPPDWNGDPKLCTIPSTITPSPLPTPPMPHFPPRAEFALQRVEMKHIYNVTLPSEMFMYQYIYDYEANKMIMVKNSNNFIDTEYYYYDKLMKATYYRGDFCVMTDIPKDNDMDGGSAIFDQQTNQWHVRPLNEFLLFSSTAPGRERTPIYLGTNVIRGIPVHTWQTCYINKDEHRTVRRIWHFAQSNVSIPGAVGDYAVPIQGIISGSYDFPDGTQAFDVDEVFNVFAYRPGILETPDALSPPKGVFCASGEGQKLISLPDAGLIWPRQFSVRVEASSSNSAIWERFHIRYDEGGEGDPRRLRYDFMPPGAQDYQSVIHDFTNQVTYTIDRRLGSCQITAGTNIPDVDPIRDPIRFFIKNEAKFITSPPVNAWEMNGFRSCRGNDIKCIILTTSLDKFPNIVDTDTEMPTGESWDATNVEYAWTKRAPYARLPPDAPPSFDYPISLYLKMYRQRNPMNPSPTGIRVADLEYEFYEMSHENHAGDFDVSICYRSLNYGYAHVGFVISYNRDDAIDNNQLDGEAFEGHLFTQLKTIMNIPSSRISGLEYEHESTANNVTVILTILDRTPDPTSQSGFHDNEPNVESANNTLRQAVNEGRLQFTMGFGDGSSPVQFTSVRGSYKGSARLMSPHSLGKSQASEEYSTSAQATAIVVGLLLGLLIGIILAAVIRIVRKDPMPAMPISMSNPFSNTGSHAKKGGDNTASSNA